MIFQSFPAFFAVYIPLVILAIFAIIFEKKSPSRETEHKSAALPAKRAGGKHYEIS